MKQFLVIGLGRFGSSIAQTLYEAHEEVLAIDVEESLVQDIIDNNIVDNAVIIDATDIKSLNEVIGKSIYDVAFVCTKDVESSIMITLNLKELGVKEIIAKAGSKRHGKVLLKIGATKIIYPEEYMGRRIAQLTLEPNMIEHLRFSKDFLFVELKNPQIFWKKTISQLEIRSKFNLNIVGIKKLNNTFIPNPHANTELEEGDILLVVTDAKSIKDLEQLK
ncbi:potassium channel family protein [Fusobacterium sp. PH5-44]|uniref:potassium channel family protein n=1 Tax=unclassified Fusobacterium TaxID=2648384 RepID=UPI003D208B20